MPYERSVVYKWIREDLELTEGKRELVKAGFLEKMRVKKVPTGQLHVNPDDEFSMPNIGPNEAIVENYSNIARRNDAVGEPVFEEPVLVCKMLMGGYMLQNGHHRWAGAMKARVPTVRIRIMDPG